MIVTRNNKLYQTIDSIDTITKTLQPLPQQKTPVPKTKMKTVNWNKIPPNKVIGQNNVWTIVANDHSKSPKADLSWEEMEALFCLQPSHSSPKLGRENSSEASEKKCKRENEITLLDGKRSLNINIFLKQFRR